VERRPLTANRNNPPGNPEPSAPSRAPNTFRVLEDSELASERHRDGEKFLSRLYSVRPFARQLTDEGRCRLVMGDKLRFKLPREIQV